MHAAHLALLQPAMQLYFRNMKYLSIVVIATRQLIFFLYILIIFFVKIMEKISVLILVYL